MNFFTTLAFVLLFSIEAAQAQNPPVQAAVRGSAVTAIAPAKEADIRRLQELRGDKALIAQAMDQMSKDIKPLMTKALPAGQYREKLVDLFFVKFQSIDGAQEILNMAVPLYDKHFSAEEVKSLLQFYQSPVGQKLAAETPALAGELSALAQKWGEDQGRKCMLQVLADNPDLAKDLEAATEATAKISGRN